MDYNFDWNSAKEKQNIRKHQLNFRLASTVFRDPYQLTIYDEEHSQDEDRWITIGLDETGILRLVIHTFEETDRSSCMIRIISARKATFIETQSYQERQL
ncbi:BrnT family toxin [Argonema antarcticum A004/B2]|nr:BrnT family toxin [Argonema antarcticum A004/B2]